MANTDDMSTPVTRGELRQELEQLEARLDQKLDQRLDQKLDQKLAHLATKVELEVWGGALLARIESGEHRLMAHLDAREHRLLERVDQRIEGFEQRLLAELARHTRAIQESMSTQISVVDDKYADLPGRVGRIEAKVFAPKRNRPR